MPKTETQTFDIPIMSILKVIGVLLGVFLFFKIWQVAAALFFAVVISAALEPTLRWFEKKNIKRIFSVPGLYLLSFSAMFGIFYAILPALFNEIFLLSQNLPSLLSQFVQDLSRDGSLGNAGFLVPAIDEFLNTLQDRIGGVTSNVFGFLSQAFGGILSFSLVILFSFYLSLRRNEIEKSILAVTPNKHHDYLKDLIRRIQRRTGRWMQMFVVLATFMGVAVFIMMTILGVEFALTVGLLAGFLELIPYIGPFIAGGLILAAGSTKSVAVGLIALGLYVVLQQVEQAVIIPLVMSRALQLSPLAILLSIVVGAELAGLWGLIISIPLVLTMREIMRDRLKTS